MKKSLLILIILICSSFSLEKVDTEIISVIATYSGQSDKAIYFKSDENAEILEFKFIRKEVLSKYNLSDKAFINKKFKLTYYVDLDDVESNNDEAEIKTMKKRLTLFDMEEIK